MKSLKNNYPAHKSPQEYQSDVLPLWTKAYLVTYFLTKTLVQKLPIHTVLPELSKALEVHSRVIVQAPPGAGKTTIVPLSLLETPWLAGRKILVLEPRRLAARAVCARMAHLLGEKTGERVGYTMRLDNRTGPRTRIEVITEGVLTRRFLNDPEMTDTGAIIFDEFHERSIQADLGLTLALEVQEALRNDLRILIMSATLDAASLTHALGKDAPVITAKGQTHPVETLYVPTPSNSSLEQHTCAVIRKALTNTTKSFLVFLPGAPEIHRVMRLLKNIDLPDDIHIYPLFGGLSTADQDKAIAPPPSGQRKIVLATSIAETSLTIEGIRIVVDAGRSRLSRYSPRTGMDRLETLFVSKSSADQRQGRAGRLEPGICYRLWSKTKQLTLADHSPVEIENTDLCDLVLSLAEWGTTDTNALTWVTPPPPAHIQQARSLLIDLGALDNAGRITSYGKKLCNLGTHPRLAHLMLQAKHTGMGWTGCLLAALLMERDIMLHTPEIPKERDIRIRLDLLGKFAKNHHLPAGVHKETCRRILQQARIWARNLKIPITEIETAATGILLAKAFPDRIAMQRSRQNTQGYIMANGRGAKFPNPDPLTVFPWLVIPELDEKGTEATIYLAAPVDQTELKHELPALWSTRQEYQWNASRKELRYIQTHLLGAIPVARQPLTDPDPDHMAQALLRVVREHGLEILPWNSAALSWRNRVYFLHKHGMDIPDFTPTTLLAELEEWLYPFLLRDARSFKGVNLLQALKSRMTWDQLNLVDKHAPTHLTVPSGSRIPIDYSGDTPVLAVRIQEIFGWTQTPMLAGHVPLCIHLLSPAHRPVQITSDLTGFWKTGYPEIKKELKGRYPKHYWPDDPLTAQASKRTRPR